MATYNVDVYLDDVWIKTYYGVSADSQGQAEQHILDKLPIDVSAEEND